MEGIDDMSKANLMIPEDCPYNRDSFEDCSMRSSILRCKRADHRADGFRFSGCSHANGICIATFSDVMRQKGDVTVTVNPFTSEARVCVLHGLESGVSAQK